MEKEPPMKKQKTENLDEFIENIKKSTKNLTPILKDELFEDIPSVYIYAGHIKDTKLISKTMQVLNEKLPLGDLQHLKRVSQESVLLCSEEYFKSMEFTTIEDYIEHRLTELKDVFDYFKLVPVASKPPLTKTQNAECKRQWPCNFHPNPYTEKLASGQFFNKTDLSLHRKYMAITLYISKWYEKNELNEFSNAAIIVDPKLKTIIAIAYDNRKKHPIQHASMIAIDNVAKTQGGGSWTGWNEKELIHELKNKFQIDFGIENFTDIETPYLCTNYNIYLIKEPCLMCAMGLLHARVKRVFYLFDNVQGGLKTKTKLHCLPGLNHRYEVFTGFDVL